ncbi:MAG: NifU family protein [Acidimicrobiales bacterium]|nr:NifU family protein [Acidimicrobiales bacterium]MBO0892827.1 NifU family protein [Acidimicrobiales bacterium]
MTSDPTFSPVLRVSDAARAMVLEARTGEADGDKLALWLEVTGVGDGAYTYDLYFQSPADAGPGDAVQHHDELVVVVPEASVSKLQGATLDVAGEDDEAGMVVINPNTPSPPIVSRPPADLSGEVAQRVLTVLETQVNPSIAAHGGRADLVAVEEGTAYLRLSGGCQGCGLASVTLTQGISVAISDSVPEVTNVVDVTDHQSGTNPYYEPAKK